MKDYTKVTQDSFRHKILSGQAPAIHKPVNKKTSGNKTSALRVILLTGFLFIFIVVSMVITEIANKVASDDNRPKIVVQPKYPAPLPLPKPPASPYPQAENKPDTYKNPFPEVKQHLDIQTAYALTNVERVEFSKERSHLPANISNYLEELFLITDFLVIERVSNHRILNAGQPIDLKAYDIAIKELRSMTVPQKLAAAHANIVSAIENEKTYFYLMQTTGEKFNANHAMVTIVNNQLITAWKLMGKALNSEEKRNLYSFEKHLCALDFI